MCPFDYTDSRLVGRLRYPVHLFHNTNSVAVVTPTDCRKSVRNRCLIEDLVVLVCCRFALDLLLVYKCKRFAKDFVRLLPFSLHAILS